MIRASSAWQSAPLRSQWAIRYQRLRRGQLDLTGTAKSGFSSAGVPSP